MEDRLKRSHTQWARNGQRKPVSLYKNTLSKRTEKGDLKEWYSSLPEKNDGNEKGNTQIFWKKKKISVN